MVTIKKILSLILRKIKKEKFISFFAIFLILTLITLNYLDDKFLIEIPKNSGELHEIIIGQNPRFINPVLAMSETDKALISLIYSPLLKKNKTNDLIPNIADYTISDDSKQYTIKLQNNIYFHDGFKMSIDDVIYTIEQIQDPLNDSFYRPQWNSVELKKIDNLTLEISLPKEDHYFKSALELYVLPKHIWEKVDYFNLTKENLNPTGSGPFKINKIEWDSILNNNGIKDEKIHSLILEKNLNYFKKQPYIEKIIFNFFDSRNDYLNSDNNIGKYQNYYSYDKWDKKINFKIYPITESVDFNLTIKKNNSNSFLNNKEIRKYIFEIWNSEESKNEELKLLLLKNPDFEEDVENNLLKYKGEIINFSTILGNNEDNSLNLLAEKLKNKLRKAGIVTNLKILDEADFWDNLRDRNFESIISGYQNDERNWYYYYHSSQKDDPGVNIADFNSNKIDTLLLDLRKNLKDEDRKIKIQELKKEIDSYYLVLNLEKQKSYYHLKTEIDSMNLDNIISGEKRFDFIQDWVLETEKILPFFKK